MSTVEVFYEQVMKHGAARRGLPGYGEHASWDSMSRT